MSIIYWRWEDHTIYNTSPDRCFNIYEPAQDGIFDIGVSGDGTWSKRGYSSSYGVVTALSTITGKALGGLGAAEFLS